MSLTHAYKEHTPSSSLKSPRENEFEIILSITRELKRCDTIRTENYNAYISSIYSNRKLWTLLISDVANLDNMLPSDIKSRIFYLGEFVEHYSRKAISDNLCLIPLIEINLAILRGLNNQGRLA